VSRYASPLISRVLVLTRRTALRWLVRYVTEGKAVTLLSAHLALSALGELRAGDGRQAAKLLTELATRPPPS
jgi:hypothetical protein